MLLRGHLSLPADPNPEFFAIGNVVDQGRWYSQFPIGGPMVLALAMLFRATWLHNEVLRQRFSDRPWYRIRLAPGSAGRDPRIVPYR